MQFSVDAVLGNETTINQRVASNQQDPLCARELVQQDVVFT